MTSLFEWIFVPTRKLQESCESVVLRSPFSFSSSSAQGSFTATLSTMCQNPDEATRPTYARPCTSSRPGTSKRATLPRKIDPAPGSSNPAVSVCTTLTFGLSCAPS
ncbi:MAG: hypothetical protein QM704_21615 [Anaeromyxobacteraceae bacterium]